MGHTKGPWKTVLTEHEKSGEDTMNIEDAKGLIIAQCVNHFDDARLIASAPELLELVKAFEANPLEIADPVFVRKMRAVMAKAEGIC